jgi:UDP-glucose 4-epimerase
VQRALVTGGTGFIGRRLCTALGARDVRVRASARTPVSGPWEELVPLNLADGSSVSSVMTGIDTVFHLAARVHASDDNRADSAHWEVNAEGTRRLLRAARDAGVKRFVYFSSVKAVGEPGDACADEAFDAPPETAYGRSKRAAEGFVTEAGQDGALHVSILRPSLVYGRGCKGNVARMLSAVRRGLFPPLPEVRNRRSLVHVDDVVTAAILAAISAPAHGGVYILTDGEAYSTRRIYEAMCHAVDRGPASWTVPVSALRIAARGTKLLSRIGLPYVPFRSSTPDRLLSSAWYTSERVRSDLGWKSKRTLEEALPEMVQDMGSLSVR